MDKMDKEKLKMILKHWNEHNNSHAASFREQAEVADKIGLQDVKVELLLAAEAMDRAGNHLRRAMVKL